MIRQKTIDIDVALSGQTLASVLRRAIGNLTWSQARQLIASRRVQVNGGVCLDDARRLKNGETVDVIAEAPAPAERDVQIVYSDSDLVVVEKPPGMQTVRRIEERNWSDERKARQPVLSEVVQLMINSADHANAREKHRGAAKTMARLRPKAPAPRRVRAVHRLDRDTSGLMLFALSPSAETELIRRFSSHEIQRLYRAVVLGNVREPKTMESWIVRDRGDGIRGSLPAGTPSPLAQRAVTHMRPIEHIGNDFTIVECKLETGRTHQIRIHMTEIGHPLCGEKVYLNSRPGEAMIEDKSGSPRQALHSVELEFEHPTTGRPMRFESPWPADLARWMAGLSK